MYQKIAYIQSALYKIQLNHFKIVKEKKTYYILRESLSPEDILQNEQIFFLDYFYLVSPKFRMIRIVSYPGEIGNATTF